MPRSDFHTSPSRFLHCFEEPRHRADARAEQLSHDASRSHWLSLGSLLGSLLAVFCNDVVG